MMTVADYEAQVNALEIDTTLSEIDRLERLTRIINDLEAMGTEAATNLAHRARALLPQNGTIS